MWFGTVPGLLIRRPPVWPTQLLWLTPVLLTCELLRLVTFVLLRRLPPILLRSLTWVLRRWLPPVLLRRLLT